jgi:hypothetical protein
VKTRKELEKFQALYHQNLSSIKASEGLATIMNQKRNSKLKTGLGYEEGSSNGQSSNEEPIKFVKSKTCNIPLWRTYKTYSLRTLARK